MIMHTWISCPVPGVQKTGVHPDTNITYVRGAGVTFVHI